MTCFQKEEPSSARSYFGLGLLTVSAASLVLFSPALAAAAIVAVAFLAFANVNLIAAVFALVIAAPWGTFGNVLLGSRFFALGLDAAFALACVHAVVTRDYMRARGRTIAVVFCATFVLVGLGTVGLLNPRGIGVAGGLEGFRAFFFPILALPVGYGLASRSVTFRSSLLLVLLVTALVVSAMGIRQTLAPMSLDYSIIANSQSGLLPFQVTGSNRLRAFSPMPGPFHYGLLMTLAILVVGARMLREATLLRIGAFAVLVLSLGLNATRLNWLGALAGGFALFLTSLDRKHIRRGFTIIAVSAMLVVMLAWIVTVVPALTPVRLMATELILNPTANSSYVYRVLGWQYEVFPAIAHAPIIGWGTGAAKDGVGLFRSHNVFFKLVLEGGFIVLSVYVLLTVAIVMELLRRRQHDIARIGLGLVVAVHAAGMFGPILDAYPVSMYYWMILGAALSAPTAVAEYG